MNGEDYHGTNSRKCFLSRLSDSGSPGLLLLACTCQLSEVTLVVDVVNVYVL